MGGTATPPRCTIRTDHVTLKWTLKLAEATCQLAQWRPRLSEMGFDLVHCTGVKHQATDTLLLLPKTSWEYCNTIDDV